ncbi:MAG TPA: endonuclease/exonuclease/phosphatase family protein, partial [Planctomycetaceae bacterium]
HKGIGGRDRRYRPERVLAAIAREEPDLICLQEVDTNVRRSRFHDQPRMFSDILGGKLGLAEHVFQLNVPIGAGGYGNLILSRFPLDTHHSVCLRRGRRKPRGAQVVVVRTPDGPLRLVNWHLGLAEKERHWQVRKLLSDAAFRNGDELPSLIVGDFNDWRNTLAAGPFTEYGYTKLTWPPKEFRSFPAYMPLGALDKAFARGDLALDRARVVLNRLTRDASDHLPVVIDIDLKPAKASA